MATNAAAASTAIPENRRLAKKEADLFKSVVKFYETKQYKKAIKAADQILKKYPNHGETLAMKGLTLNGLDKKDEAYEHVRNGLRNDLKSHVCWHVFGLLYRSDRNYSEAIKCYLNALRIDSNNLQILRDLSFLQIQMRDLKGFLETRRQVLVSKSNNKQHWVAYAVANYLAKDFDKAVHVIDSFTDTVEGANGNSGPLYEDSELCLFKFQCLKEKGQYDAAREHLLSCRAQIKDVLTWRESLACVTLLLQRWDEAQQAYLDLIATNTENYRYHAGLQAAVLRLETNSCLEMLALTACDLPCTLLDLTQDQRVQLGEIYRVLQSTHKKSTACTRIPLAFQEGDTFRSSLLVYICKHVRKGVPSLGSDLDGLYRIEIPNHSEGLRERHRRVRATDPYDVRVHPIANLVLEIIQECLSSVTSLSILPSYPEPAHPSDTLWLNYLQAHLYEAMGEYSLALESIDKCIDHTPTAVDMYMKKARILKRCGDIQSAAVIVDGARKLDLSDRYINNKACKYLLRAGQEQQALATIALFTRHEGADPGWSLSEMQCVWYELEHAEAHMRESRWGRALKKLLSVEKHFNDFVEDQFDFHSYCIRKGTIGAYTDLLKLEDRIYAHKYFQRAASDIIDIYVTLHQQPQPSDVNADANGPNVEALSAEERKKLKNKLRKEKRKQNSKETDTPINGAAANEEESKKQVAAGANNPNPKGTRGGPAPDDDPEGDKLLAKQHLIEADRFSKMLESHAGSSPLSQLRVFKVKMLRKAYLPALRAVTRMLRACSPNQPFPLAHWALVQLAQAVADDQATLQACGIVYDVITEGLSCLLSNQSVETYVDALVSSCIAADPDSHTLLYRCVSARLLLHLHGPEAVDRARACLHPQESFELRGRGVTINATQEALQFLRESGPLQAPLEGLVKSLEAAVSNRFPLANFVGGGLKVEWEELWDPSREHIDEAASSTATAITASVGTPEQQLAGQL